MVGVWPALTAQPHNLLCPLNILFNILAIWFGLSKREIKVQPERQDHPWGPHEIVRAVHLSPCSRNTCDALCSHSGWLASVCTWILSDWGIGWACRLMCLWRGTKNPLTRTLRTRRKGQPAPTTPQKEKSSCHFLLTCGHYLLSAGSVCKTFTVIFGNEVIAAGPPSPVGGISPLPNLRAFGR